MDYVSITIHSPLHPLSIILNDLCNKVLNFRYVFFMYPPPSISISVYRRYEVAKLLGGHGAAVNLRGKSGSTAFDIANMLGRLLVEMGGAWEVR